jgi:uncharacterized protein
MGSPSLRALGAAGLVLGAALVPVAGSAADTAICAIQGTTATPAMLGARVTTSGVVTRDFIAAGLEGFFLQEPGCDLDPATSDGIFVRVGTRRPAVVEGHKVAVTGRVVDTDGLTAIDFESLTDSGASSGALEVAPLSPPADPVAAAAYLEAREGMLVAVPPSRVVAATDRSGEAWVVPEASGVTRLYHGDADGAKVGLAAPGAWLSLDTGDRLGDAVGPLISASGAFKVLLRGDRLPAVQRAAAAPPRASTPGGGLTLASYDLDRFFAVGGTLSGPQYAVDLARRAASIGLALGSPDVVGVQEAETTSVLEDLAAQPELAAARYRAVLIDGPGPQGLDVGLLYNSAKLFVRSAEARQTCSDVRPLEGPATGCALPAGGSGYLLYARPPLVVRLEVVGTGERLDVVVAHFQPQVAGETADERVRLAMADHVRGLATELKAAEPATPVVVMGLLNDFEESAPLARLTADGTLVSLFAPPQRERPYTHASQGVSEAVDHILVDPLLVPRVAGFGPLHVNVDFAAAAPGAPIEASARASDHDPVLLVLR